MTPAETEHFAALRMHVARLHVALQGAVTWLEGWAEVGSAKEPYDQSVAALAMSEPDVRELLTDAERDSALVACRARLAEVEALSGQLEADLVAVRGQLAIVLAAARAVVAADAGGAASDGASGDALQEAIRTLGEVLPA